MSSGPESSSVDKPENLTVTNITASSISLAWSAPDNVYASFSVELGAPSQAHVTSLPGSVRKAEIDGLNHSTRYDITLRGLVEGRSSVPLRAFATTGTRM